MYYNPQLENKDYQIRFFKAIFSYVVFIINVKFFNYIEKGNTMQTQE